jgi:uncharacterized protein YkwD
MRRRFSSLVGLRRWALGAGLSCAAGCGHAGPLPVEPVVDTASDSTPTVGQPTPARIAAPRGPLTIADARRYMVSLVNQDRAQFGLSPVSLDEGPPTRAGQRHAEDMAARGFLGHWGSDGSVPEQRHTDAGGDDMVLENASCFVDERERTLDGDARIDPKNVERAEEMFFNEVPPHDGHRKNILKPHHTHVGIGIAQPVATATEIPVPCFAQEFVDDHGTYKPIARQMRVGDMVHVEGALAGRADIAGVGLARVDAPRPLSPAEANKRRSYPVPAPYQMYWPAGFRTPIPLKVSGKSFSIDVPVSDRGRAGLYEVSIWGKFPGSEDFVMIGLRTVQVF